ncbi:MAG: hypothetical protein C4524_03250 [Candidatus Zixiibacteriota bacterium]|nr:MAG: hypothetical protein C4524_03250 [candidate division Zixibacteria bacterium]
MNAQARALQDLFYRLFNGLVMLLGGLPRARRSYALARVLGALRTRFGYIGAGWSRERYRETIRTFFPDLFTERVDDLVKAYWVNHQKRFVELFLARDLKAENLPRLVEFQGLEHLDRALERGKGVILPVPHLGNERLHHIALAVKGYPLAVISSRYEDHGPFAREVKLEAARRFHEVGHAGDTAWLLRMLKQNRVLQVSPDAEADANAVPVHFLGQDLLLPTGWLRLALMTGAAILPSVLLRRDDDRHLLVMLPEFRPVQNGDRDQTLRHNVQAYMDLIAPWFQQRSDQIDWMSLAVRLEETRAANAGNPVIQGRRP